MFYQVLYIVLYIDKTETGSVAQKMHRARFWVNQ